MANSAYWTTAREFTLDPIIAVSKGYEWTKWTIPEYTYKLSTVGHKRIRPRCEDLQQVVVLANVTHGRID